MTREELRQAIWPGTFVEFNEGLDAAIYKLRSALGDSAEEPRFVETLPRRGYRFIGVVDGVVAAAGQRDAPPLEERATDAMSKRWPMVTGGLIAAIALWLAARWIDRERVADAAERALASPASAHR